MPHVESLESFARVVMPALFGGLWKGILLAGAVAALLHRLSTRPDVNATTRHAILLATLVAVVGLPLLDVRPAPPPATGPGPAIGGSPAPFTPAASAPEAPTLGAPLRPAGTGAEGTDVAAPRGSALLGRHLTLPGGAWVSGLAAGWACVAGLLLVRIGWGLGGLRRLKRRSRPLSAARQALVTRWQPACGARRRARVATSDHLPAPVAVGFFDPVILLPSHVVERLTDLEFEQVYLHELAHLQRWDDWTNLFHRGAEALLFFHPAVYWLGRQMDLAREMACDDWVVSRTRAPKAYATCLARLAELGIGTRPAPLAPGIAASREHLFTRVRTLLGRREVSLHLSKAACATAAVLLVLFLGLGDLFFPSFSLAHPPAPGLAARPAAPPAPGTRAPGFTGPSAGVPASPAPDRPGRPGETPAADPDPGATGPAGEPPEELLPEELVADAVEGGEAIPTPAPQPPAPRAPALAVQDKALSTAALIRTLQAAATIPSSGDKARFLIEASPRLPEDAAVFAAYLETARTIPSSGDGARALMALLAHHRLGREAALRFLDVAAHLTSNGEKTSVLVAAVARIPNDPDVRDGYLDAARTISSPSDQSQAFAAWLQGGRN
jgi:hypothetical protein